MHPTTQIIYHKQKVM